MKKRTVAYLKRKSAFESMQHPKGVKSLLLAEFRATKNILVKRDIIRTLEQLEQKTN